MTFDFASDEKLLDIDTICQKLSISRSTFERLRKPRSEQVTGISDDHGDYAGLPQFPEPTLMLGRSPRWSASALNTWIATPTSEKARTIQVEVRKRTLVRR